MSASPTPPPPAPRQPEKGKSPGSGERAKAFERAKERYGPLRIERLRKDDGRALILYEHDEHGGGPT